MLLLLSAMATGVPVRAQYSDLYYHRVGDTIEMRSPIGYYTWWKWEYYLANQRLVGCVTAEGRGERMLRFYTPVPLTIVGIAGIPGSVPVEPEMFNQELEMNYHEYFRIYEATPSGHPLVAQAKWNLDDPHRYLHLRGHGHQGEGDPCGAFTCCCERPWERVLPLYEYYFDTPFYVTDSFYVGGTFYNNWVDETDTKTFYFVASGEGNNYSCINEPMNANHCFIMGVTYMYRFADNEEWQWATFSDTTEGFPFVDLIFPLIQVDTTMPPEGMCVPVENVQVMAMADSSALVTWDGFPNYTVVEVSYGPRNLPEGQWTVVRVEDSTMYRISDLSPSFPFYGLKVRAVCNDEKTPTMWSEVVWFQPEAGSSTEGINGNGTLLSQGVFLAPNPASDVLTVTSSFSLRNINIYNTNGLLVYSEPAGGHESTVPLHDFLPGVYLMEIDTHGGTTHKKFFKGK